MSNANIYITLFSLIVLLLAKFAARICSPHLLILGINPLCDLEKLFSLRKTILGHNYLRLSKENDSINDRFKDYRSIIFWSNFAPPLYMRIISLLLKLVKF
jgi:hypothetical protein